MVVRESSDNAELCVVGMNKTCCVWCVGTGDPGQREKRIGRLFAIGKTR